jgi:1-phosphatidylinositol-4-phosphate 5-kinase
VRHCGGARAARGRERLLVVEPDGDGEARQDDGEGGGRRRWEGAPAAVAGDGAARKRQGETVAKGHKNYELMLNLQLGIR